MRKLNFLVIMVLALSLIGAVVGCGEATPTPTATPTSTPTATPVEPIKIGLLEDVTGPIGPYGSTYLTGEKVAVQMINDAGGIKSLGGAKLEIAFGSGDSTVSTSVSEVERLITSEKVVAVVGPTSTGETIACIPMFERYKTPCVAGLQDETQYQKGYRFLFGVFPSNLTIGRLQGDFIDWLAKNHGAPTDRIAIATGSPSYISRSEALVDRLAELGYTNIVLNEEFPLTVMDQSPLVLKMKAVNPSLVIYNGTLKDTVLFHKAADTYDFFPWLVMDQSAYGTILAKDALADMAKKALTRPNIFGFGTGAGSAMYDDIPSLRDFQNAFQKAFPGSTLDRAQVSIGGAKVFVLARAIEEAASRNPEDIAAALRKVDIQAPDPYLVWADQYPELKMSDNGQTVSANAMALQWADDLSGLQTVWPVNLANAEPKK